jgi:hypothetical protein
VAKKMLWPRVVGGGGREGVHYNSHRVCQFGEDVSSSPLDEGILGPGRRQDEQSLLRTR